MRRIIPFMLALLCADAAQAADNAVIVTPGVGVTMRSRDVGAGVQSMFHILGDTAGASIYGTAGTANTNILTVQGIAAMTPFLATLTGTNNVNATLGAETTKVIGTVRGVGNVGGVFDAIGQNVAAPANWLQAGCQFNTTPTTITTGNGSPCQLDSAGNLLVNIKAATALSVNATLSAETTKNIGTVRLSDGTNTAAVKAASTAPIATDPAVVVAISPNSVNANGQATMANSAPVAIASNQSAIAAWGQVATGAAPPTGAQYIGANASGATGGLVAGLIQCDSTAIYDASTSGSTELKALTSGRSIYVCGYSILSGGTVNVKLIYGTGTACATGSNNMTPAYQLTAQVGIADGSAFFRGLKTASANALCINTSAGIAVQAIVYYSVI